MRASIEFQSDNDFRLIIQHNHIIQGFIYNSISTKLAKLLHDRGFQANGRNFKLFTFSRIQGNFRIDKDKGTITYSSPFSITISSAINQFIEELGNEMLSKELIRIGGNTIKVNSINISNPNLSEKNKINMLSPVTIYSTLQKADGKKKTYYYSPFEEEFSRLISENAKKKFKAFQQIHPRKLLPGIKDKDGLSNRSIELKPLNVKSSYQKIINYKGTIIKGWTGTYELSGDPELTKLVYDTGLGGKNSQGFGCFELVKN